MDQAITDAIVVEEDVQEIEEDQEEETIDRQQDAVNIVFQSLDYRHLGHGKI